MIRVFASVAIRERGRILMVREEEEDGAALWNLPGGGLEAGESVMDCARREAEEEAGLGVFLTELVGVFTGKGASGAAVVRFVFGAHTVGGEAAPGDGIRELGYKTFSELAALPDDALDSPRFLRPILAAIEEGIAHPMAAVVELEEMKPRAYD